MLRKINKEVNFKGQIGIKWCSSSLILEAEAHFAEVLFKPKKYFEEQTLFNLNSSLN